MSDPRLDPKFITDIMVIGVFIASILLYMEALSSEFQDIVAQASQMPRQM
jgi:hypothetical protein